METVFRGRERVADLGSGFCNEWNIVYVLKGMSHYFPDMLDKWQSACVLWIA
jgi:hypothetical protein